MKNILRIILVILFIVLLLPQATNTHGQGEASFNTFLPITVNNFDPLWHLTDPQIVDLQPHPFSTPYLIVDSSGKPHLLWDTWSGSNAFIYHTYLSDQGWSTTNAVSPTLGTSRLLNPPVAGNDNKISLVWYNQLNSGGPYRILYAGWNGSSWSPEYELLGTGKSIYINGIVRFDRQGQPNVSFIDSDGFLTSNVYYQKWTGSGFSPRQQVTKPTYSSLIWLDQDNGIHFYGDDYNSRVRYSYWRNGTFVVNDRISPGRIYSRRSLLDGQNNLHLVRLASVPVPGGNVSGIYHQCLKNDGTWSPEQVITGQNNTSGYLLSYNNLMEPIIAWSKGNNTTMEVTLWNGCDISEQREITLPEVPGSSGWGELVGISANTLASKVCLISKEKYSASTLLLTCN